MVHRTEESPGRDEWYRWDRVEKVDQEKTKKGGEGLLGNARLRVDRRGERQGREKRVVWTGAEHTDGVTAGAARRHKATRSGMKESRDGRQTFEVGGERVERSEW